MGCTTVAKAGSVSGRRAIYLLVAALATAPAAWGLKYAAPAHDLKPDPDIPVWKPASLRLEPHEELTIVGADVMDEMTLGWVRMICLEAISRATHGWRSHQLSGVCSGQQ